MSEKLSQEKVKELEIEFYLLGNELKTVNDPARKEFLINKIWELRDRLIEYYKD